MKVAIIGDTHFGARADSVEVLDYFNEFYENIFFPEIDKRGITRIIHLGDLVDRRKYINFNTANRLFSDFINKILKRNITLDIIVGNHDTFFKNSNEVNAPKILLSSLFENTRVFEFDKNIRIFDRPKEVNIDGINVLYLPWIAPDIYEESMKAIKKCKTDLCFGHLEINGFEMYKMQICDGGLKPELFNKFDKVFSGHFHHKSSEGNIHFLGAPYEMIWSDHEDERGFHIFDFSDRSLEFIKNPYSMFRKIQYDDEKQSEWNIIGPSLEYLKNCFVKVIITSKTKPSLFEDFIKKIENVGVLDIQVVEDHYNFDIVDEQEIVNEAEDTITILTKYVDQLNVPHSNEVKKFLTELYIESLRQDDD